MLVDLAVLFCLTDPLTAPKIPAEIVVLAPHAEAHCHVYQE